MRHKILTVVFAATTVFIGSAAIEAQDKSVDGVDGVGRPDAPLGGGALPGWTCTGSGAGCPLDLPDQVSGAQATVDVQGCATVTNVQVGLDVQHTWVGDLVMTLTSPDNTSVVIYDRPLSDGAGLGCSGDDILAILDDTAPSAVEDECAAAVPTINGTFSPNNPLSTFTGETGDGTWTLTIDDVFGGDAGILREWSIDPCNELSGLSIVKSDNPDPVNAGANLTYTIMVTNNGPDDRTNVEVTDTLPAGVMHQSDTGSCVEAPVGTLTCPIGSLDDGAQASFTVEVTVDPDVIPVPLLTTVIENLASVRGDYVIDPPGEGLDAILGRDGQPLPDIDDILGVANGDCDVSNGTPGCNDEICESLICSQDPFCCSVSWDQNCADAAIEQCEGYVPPPPPSDCTIANGTPGCDDATCESLICAQDPFCCSVEWDSLCSTAAIEQCDLQGPPPLPEDPFDIEQTTVNRLSQVWIEKGDDPDPAMVGDLLRYTLTFGNFGPSVATNVSVQDQLPGGMTFIGCEPVAPQDGITCGLLGGNIVDLTSLSQGGPEVWSSTDPGLNALAPGETYSFVIVVRVSDTYVADGLTDAECAAEATASEYPFWAYNFASIGALTSAADDSECTQVKAPVRTTIRVTKDFNDGNPSDVNVHLDCNTGLIADQDQNLSESEPIIFIVTDYDQFELDCELSEVPVPTGYADSYVSGSEANGAAANVGHNAVSCYYEGVISGDFTCDITDQVIPIKFDVRKLWYDEHPEFNNSKWARARWSCDGVSSATGLCPIGFACLDKPTNGGPNLWFQGDDSDAWFWVWPDWDGLTTCTVEERVWDSSVETDDSDCFEVPVLLGQDVTPDDDWECTIINTRIYDGIPALSQYGLALLALLMLGIGIVGFRRVT